MLDLEFVVLVRWPAEDLETERGVAQRYSLALALQMAKWASSTARRVASATPASASTAAFDAVACFLELDRRGPLVIGASRLLEPCWQIRSHRGDHRRRSLIASLNTTSCCVGALSHSHLTDFFPASIVVFDGW
jgi:hypothetical protein